MEQSTASPFAKGETDPCGGSNLSKFIPEYKASCPSWKLYLPTVPTAPPCSGSLKLFPPPPSTELLLAAASRAHMAHGWAVVRLRLCSPLSSASPWRRPENSLKPCIALDDCSLSSCPSLFRDGRVGFSSGTLLRMEKSSTIDVKWLLHNGSNLLRIV